MHVRCSVALLAVSRLIAGRHICLEDLRDASNAVVSPPATDSSIGQSVLSIPHTWTEDVTVFAEPLKNGSNLTDAVNKKYLATYPAKMNVSQALTNVTGVVQNRFKFGWGDSKLVDVQFPLMNTCKAKASNIKPLGLGISCDQEAGCSVQRTFTLSETYGSSYGFKIGTTISAEADLKIVKASISTTYEAQYTKTWERGKQSSDSYTFNLKQNEYCTPSMIHVNLECDVMSDIVYYDTTWQDVPTNLWLEQDNQRTGGPYGKGQWCRTIHIKEDILSQEQYFDPVLDEDTPRGAAWLRPPSELNAYKQDPAEADILDEDVVIRKGKKGLGGKFNEVYVCKRYLPSTIRTKKVRIPVSGDGGSMLGFVGCV